MTKYNVILKVPASEKDSILESIKNKYPKSEGRQFSQTGDELRYMFKIKTYDTSKTTVKNLSEISGLSVVSVNSEFDMRIRIHKKYSTWLMIGLLIGWTAISYIAFSTSDNFIDSLSVSQLLVVQITIALVISIWIFLYDKRTQQDVIDVLATLDLRTSEINENVKDLDKSN